MKALETAKIVVIQEITKNKGKGHNINLFAGIVQIDNIAQLTKWFK